MSQQEPTVIDFSLFGELRTVQALRNSGIIPDDMTQGQLLVVKRINHGLFGDYSVASEKTKAAMSALQAKFQPAIKAQGFAAAAEAGQVSALLDEYLSVLITDSVEKIRRLDFDTLPNSETSASYNDQHKKEEARRDKYLKERDYYRANPDMIKELATRFAGVLDQPKFMPMGKIVAQSGVVSSDMAFAEDIVSDTLAVVSARNINLLGRHFVDDAALARFAADPAANAIRIKALAENLAKATQPLSALREFEAETPELTQIMALSKLLSVQIHQAMAQNRPIEELASVERKARDLVKSYAQVALSLAGDYLDKGASAQDKRVRTIQANLQAEMAKEGIAPLTREEAQSKAAQLARTTAEDLLFSVADDADLSAKLTMLAAAAGVDVAQKPLEARAEPAVSFLQREQDRRVLPKSPTIAA